MFLEMNGILRIGAWCLLPMTGNPSNGPSTDEGEGEDTEIKPAQVVEQYFDPSATVSEDELRDHLQQEVQGTIVDLETGGVGMTVIVERKPEDGDHPVRESYDVRRVTDFDGNPSLDWNYLGPVD